MAKKKQQKEFVPPPRLFEGDCTWRYRIVRTKDGCFSIREVYYDHPPSGGEVAAAWSAAPREPFGTSAKELMQDFKLMSYALEQPVLTEEELSASTSAHHKHMEEVERKLGPQKYRDATPKRRKRGK